MMSIILFLTKNKKIMLMIKRLSQESQYIE